MTFQELRKDLSPEYKSMTKRDFIGLCTAVDGRTRVGGPVGKGRLTAKKALQLLGAYVG